MDYLGNLTDEQIANAILYVLYTLGGIIVARLGNKATQVLAAAVSFLGPRGTEIMSRVIADLVERAVELAMADDRNDRILTPSERTDRAEKALAYIKLTSPGTYEKANRPDEAWLLRLQSDILRRQRWAAGPSSLARVA